MGRVEGCGGRRGVEGGGVGEWRGERVEGMGIVEGVGEEGGRVLEGSKGRGCGGGRKG